MLVALIIVFISDLVMKTKKLKDEKSTEKPIKQQKDATGLSIEQKKMSRRHSSSGEDKSQHQHVQSSGSERARSDTRKSREDKSGNKYEVPKSKDELKSKIAPKGLGAAGEKEQKPEGRSKRQSRGAERPTKGSSQADEQEPHKEKTAQKQTSAEAARKSGSERKTSQADSKKAKAEPEKGISGENQNIYLVMLAIIKTLHFWFVFCFKRKKSKAML